MLAVAGTSLKLLKDHEFIRKWTISSQETPSTLHFWLRHFSLVLQFFYIHLKSDLSSQYLEVLKKNHGSSIHQGCVYANRHQELSSSDSVQGMRKGHISWDAETREDLCACVDRQTDFHRLGPTATRVSWWDYNILTIQAQVCCNIRWYYGKETSVRNRNIAIPGWLAHSP